MKTVHELNEKELAELKESFFHQMQDDGSMNEVMGKMIYDEEEIPDDLIKSHYEGTFFVEEDFWCNM